MPLADFGIQDQNLRSQGQGIEQHNQALHSFFLLANWGQLTEQSSLKYQVQ